MEEDWRGLLNDITGMDTFKEDAPGLFFSCSTQLNMKFFLLRNLKILTIENSFLLNIVEHEIFSANIYENANNTWHFHIY